MLGKLYGFPYAVVPRYYKERKKAFFWFLFGGNLQTVSVRVVCVNHTHTLEAREAGVSEHGIAGSDRGAGVGA